MNIEQAIDILKNSIADYVIGEYCEKCVDNKICDDRNEDCYFQQAIDIVVTAYEKEKEKNKELESDIQQKNFEIKCLNSDIKNMYCEEGVIAILEDNFDLSREEAIQILEEE